MSESSKEAKMFHFVATLLALTIPLTTALEPLDMFKESSCSRDGIPVSISNQMDFIDSSRYFSAGSRYNFHIIAASMPDYADMREDDLYYDSCYSRNTTTNVEGSHGAAFGFRRPLTLFRTFTRPDIYFEGVPTHPFESSNRLVVTMTLTDYKNFAFLMDQRAWAVVTRVPYLEANTKRIIEEHALSHGFKRRTSCFLDMTIVGLAMEIRHW